MRPLRRCTLLALALALAARDAPAAPTTRPATRPASRPAGRTLHVLFTTNVDGRYAWPGCGTRDPRRADLSHLVSAVRRASAEVRAADDPAPVVVGAGAMIRPDLLGEHIFGEGHAWAARAVELIGRARFDALSVGGYDFGAAPQTLERYLRLVRGAGIPLLAANVRCADARDFRCARLGARGRPYLVLRRGDLRVGVFAVVRADLLQRIPTPSRGTLSVDDPLDVARQLIRQLRRREGVDVVVVLANLNLETDTPRPVLSFARQLGFDAPELIVADNLYDPSTQDFVDQIRVHDGPLIVGTDRFAQRLGHARLRYRRVDGRVRIEEASVQLERTAALPPDPRSVSIVDSLLGEVCRTLNQHLGHARLREPMSREDFLAYLMEIMRHHLGAEVAVLNDSVTAYAGFPMRGNMTRERVLRAVRSEAMVGTLRVSGDRLVKLLAPYAAGSGGLLVRGLRQRGGSWYVNNRPLLAGHHYRVATTAFVASGGDGLLALQGERFQPSWISLRRLVIRFFENDLQALLHPHDRSVDLRRDFRDPWDRWLLYGGAEVGLTLSTLAVRNGDAGTRYSLPPLTRANLTSVNARAAFAVGASTSSQTLEADLLLLYGKTWSQPQGADTTTIAESADKIQGNLLYQLSWLKNLKGPGLWYMPIPYAEGSLITEFSASGSTVDPATGQAQGYHYLNLGGTAGAGLNPHPSLPLLIKLGLALRGEPLTPGPDGSLSTGLYVGYLLRRWKAVDSPTHPLQLESRLDLYLTDLLDRVRTELSLETLLSFTLVSPLALTVGHRLYLFDDRSRSVSVANDVSVGLTVILDYRHQRF
jgi:2',3'-cyclic-nucleotide 2'-phosphodiesterase (5'-nucleotidase family)